MKNNERHNRTVEIPSIKWKTGFHMSQPKYKYSIFEINASLTIESCLDETIFVYRS